MMAMKTKKWIAFIVFWFVRTVLTAGDDTKHYFLIISARGTDFETGSYAGHAFVSWATQVGQDSMISEKTAGFYPNKKAGFIEMTFDTLQGHIENTFDGNSNDLNVPVEQIVLEVDSISWHESQRMESHLKQKYYNLFDFNCVHFVDKVVSATPLKRTQPKHFWFVPMRPLTYLKRMVHLNREKVVKMKSVWKEKRKLNHDDVYN
jgi:hypothetical protein